MIARYTSPCICGYLVRPGMKIAFDQNMRRVVMCPKCSPSAGKRKYKTGQGVVVSYKAGNFASQAYRVQSLRERATGNLAGFVIRWGACDADPRAWVKFAWVGGEFKRQLGFSIETPSHITVDDMHALVALAKKANLKDGGLSLYDGCTAP